VILWHNYFSYQVCISYCHASAESVFSTWARTKFSKGSTLRICMWFLWVLLAVTQVVLGVFVLWRWDWTGCLRVIRVGGL